MITASLSETRFDRIITLLSAWMVGGVFLDGWGHHHGATESFFTPWHFALYSGYMMLAAALFGVALLRHRQGIRPSIPPGYRLATAGAAAFFIGGVADGFWHQIFGIEHQVEAFISPPHMTLFLSGVLTVLGPFSARLRRPLTPATWRDTWPAVMGLAFAAGLAQFATEHANGLLLPAAAGTDLPYAGPLGPNGQLQANIGVAWGLSAIIVQSVMIACVLILLVSRLRPPTGAVTVILLVSVGHSLMIHNAFWQLLPVVAAGVAGDWLAPAVAAGRRPLWLLTGAVPGVLTATWMINLGIQFGIVWSVHLVSGAVLTAAVAGLAIGAVSTVRATAPATLTSLLSGNTSPPTESDASASTPSSNDRQPPQPALQES